MQCTMHWLIQLVNPTTLWQRASIRLNAFSSMHSFPYEKVLALKWEREIGACTGLDYLVANMYTAVAHHHQYVLYTPIP